jgi:hypothetical protein
MRQLITPNPNIPCAPGWCLQYVRQTYNLPARYASATEAWEMSESKHTDRNLPPGVWTPVWYGLDTTPLGHVVLRAPDGSVYSTSDLGNTPHHHPDLADLEAYYAYYKMNLTYRGWTEDVAGYPVMAADTINPESSTIKPMQEDTLSAVEVQEIKEYMHALIVGGYKSAGQDKPGVADIVTENQRRINALPDKVWEAPFVHGGTHSARTEVVRMHQRVIALTSAVTALAKNPNLTADQITDAVKAGLAEAVVDVEVTVNGKEAV